MTRRGFAEPARPIQSLQCSVEIDVGSASELTYDLVVSLLPGKPTLSRVSVTESFDAPKTGPSTATRSRLSISVLECGFPLDSANPELESS